MGKTIIYPLSLSPLTFAVIDQEGGLFLWEPDTNKRTLLVKPANLTSYDHLQLHCHYPYVCVVENYGINGLVVNVTNNNVHLLQRGDYHANHCKYPIGFLERDGELLLIHGTDWHRLDITRLSDFSLLTKREVTDENGIDYFLSSLVISPNSKQVAVNGWHWNPMDVIRVYNINDFFVRFDKANYRTDWLGENQSGYNWDRPCCWLDDKTLAVGYNPKEDVKEKSQSTIVLYDTSTVEHETYYRDGEEQMSSYYKQIKTIPFDGFNLLWDENEYGSAYNEVSGQLYFDTVHNVFIGLNEQTGLYVTDREGKLLLNNLAYAGYCYAPECRVLHKLNPEPQLAVEVSLIDELISGCM